MKHMDIDISSISPAADSGSIHRWFSSLRALILAIGAIFLAEALAMTLLHDLRGFPYHLTALLDASIVIVIVVPLVYFLSIKPLLYQMEKQQQIEQALVRSNELFSRSEQFGGFGSWEWDIVEDRVTWSGGLFRIFGLTPSEFGATFGAYVQRVHPQDQEYVRRVIQTTFYRHGIFEYENRIVRPDDQIRILYTRGKVILDEQGKPARLLGICIDVTEGRPGQGTTRQLSRIVEQTADTVVVTDAEGKIEYVNLAFEQLTGFTKEEVLGNTPGIFRSGNYDDQFHREVWSTILRGESFLGEIADTKKNGEIFYEVKTITPLRDAQGKITHFVATGKDITKHKRGEEKLRESKQRLNRVGEAPVSATGNRKR
jgi:PAS domain S-box-containing protein